MAVEDFDEDAVDKVLALEEDGEKAEDEWDSIPHNENHRHI
jgi:hypothetical protein